MSKIKLSENFIRNTVKLALNEDLFPSGDITSNLVENNKIIKVKLISNQDAIIGGLLFAKHAFSLVDKKIDGGYVTPDESAGEDDVFVSRMRLGLSKKTLGLWIVADNLRKGAALNSIQIAELILKKKIK